jgi:hypothetical protein
VDIPISDPKAKDWITTTTALLELSLKALPVGLSLRDVLTHVPRLILTHASHGLTSMTQSPELLPRSLSVSLLISPASTAALPELAPTLDPSYALGAIDGAIIIRSVAVKAYAVHSAGVLIARTLIALWSPPRKWMNDTALIVPHPGGKSALIPPLTDTRVRFGLIGLIGIG